ncbi:MAG TPA: YsnF/AvaK domain-containing protein [Kofleriaceae bacterium]|nr:YsnF/AvaK domain-containing protein [Kofleriaceae bacterium]
MNLPGTLSAAGVPEKRLDVYREVMRRGASLLVFEVPDDDAKDIARYLDSVGSLDLDAAEKRWRKSGWTRYDANAPAFAGNECIAERDYLARESNLDVVEEEVQVGKRAVPREQVRVRTVVTERPVREQVQLQEEHINVRREPVNEPISAEAADAMFTEDEFTVSATGEEAVVGKQARVVERVNVDKTAETRQEVIEETERRKDVQIEREDVDTLRTRDTDDVIRRR